MSALSEFFTHTLPSTWEKLGVMNACWVASVCHSFGMAQVLKVWVFLSNFATPP